MNEQQVLIACLPDAPYKEKLKEVFDKKDAEIVGLKARIARLEAAINFATAKDMWIEQSDSNLLEYCYVDWYADILNDALNETPQRGEK